MKRRHSIKAILVVALGLGAGCSSSQMSRIDRNRDIYETWPIEVKQAVLDGKVWTPAGLHIVKIVDSPKKDIGYALLLRVIM